MTAQGDRGLLVIINAQAGSWGAGNVTCVMERPDGPPECFPGGPTRSRATTGADDRRRQDDLMRQAWEDFRRHQEFEHLLIDRKTSWLLTTQGLMFTHMGSQSTLDKTKAARAILCWVGVSVSAIIGIEVVAVVSGKYRAWKDYHEFLRTRPGFLPIASWKGEGNVPGLRWAAFNVAYTGVVVAGSATPDPVRRDMGDHRSQQVPQLWSRLRQVPHRQCFQP